MQNYMDMATNPEQVTKNFQQLNNGFLYKNPFFINTEQIRDGSIQRIINENAELFFTFSHYYNIVSSLIKFKNLPSLYTSTQVMRILVEYGSCAICKKGDNFYIAPFFIKNARFNETGEPVEIELTEYTLFNLGKMSFYQNLNGKNLVFKNSADTKEFCIINTTPSNLPLFYVIYYYSLKLIDVQNAIDQNLFVLQQPLIFSGNDNHKLDLQQLYQKIINKVRAIFLLKRPNVTDNKLEVLDLNAKNNLESFQNHKDFVKKEFFEFFGINAVPYEKKERMLVDEVNSNNMLLELVQSTYYNTILESVEKCNKYLNLNIQVEFNVNGFINQSGNKGGDDDVSNDETI